MTHLTGVCTTEGAGTGRKVHLAFFVNGKSVAQADDRSSPLLTGNTGIVVAMGPTKDPVEAEFDNFVVRKP